MSRLALGLSRALTALELEVHALQVEDGGDGIELLGLNLQICLLHRSACIAMRARLLYIGVEIRRLHH